MQTTETIDPAESKRKAHKAQQAITYSNLQSLLEEGENLLSFTRGKIAGGVQGKLFMGIESFFVPDVNIGLTDRRVIFQHLSKEGDRAKRVSPHSFPLSEVLNAQYLEADAFHDPNELGRLFIQLVEEQHCRIRLFGQGNCDDAREFAEVFQSLTSGRHKASASPVQNLCAECNSILDNPAKFCPYCGVRLPEPPTPPTPEESTAEPAEEVVAEVVAETVTETATETIINVEVTAEVETVVEVEVEIETEVVVEPVAQEVSAPLDEAEPVKESPLEPTPAPEPESPSDTVKSWDAYAQRVMGEKSGLNIEGGKA